MKSKKYKFFILVNLMFLLNSSIENSLAQTKQNSIIKLFCLQSVKEEMLRAEIEYNEKIANETCQCYYEEFKKTASHQDAKTQCKLETKEILNHNRTIQLRSYEV